jgi:hypothetical protein
VKDDFYTMSHEDGNPESDSPLSLLVIAGGATGIAALLYLFVRAALFLWIVLRVL